MCISAIFIFGQNKTNQKMSENIGKSIKISQKNSNHKKYFKKF